MSLETKNIFEGDWVHSNLKKNQSFTISFFYCFLVFLGILTFWFTYLH